MKIQPKIISLTTMFVALTLVSCNKKENEDFLNDSQATIESENEEMMFRDEEILTGDCTFDWSQVLAPCAVVTESQVDFPKTITIDYGTGCTNANGVTKKGKIIVAVSAPLKNVGATRAISFDGFEVNNVAISGTRNLENTGINAENRAVISVTATLTFVRNNITRTRVINHTREWIGYETCQINDDEFYVSGSGSVSRNNGPSRPYTIETPIHLKHSCNYPLSGKINIGALSNRGAIINFGDGVCDEFAEVTMKRNGNTRIFNMLTRSFE